MLLGLYSQLTWFLCSANHLFLNHFPFSSVFGLFDYYITYINIFSPCLFSSRHLYLFILELYTVVTRYLVHFWIWILDMSARCQGLWIIITTKASRYTNNFFKPLSYQSDLAQQIIFSPIFLICRKNPGYWCILLLLGAHFSLAKFILLLADC